MSYGGILHVARATDDGFEVIEVWECNEQVDAFKRDDNHHLRRLQLGHTEVAVRRLSRACVRH